MSSVNSMENFEIKACRQKLQMLAHPTYEDIKKTRDRILRLTESDDERTKFNSNKLLVDLELKLIDFEIKMFERDNPIGQGSEQNGESVRLEHPAKKPVGSEVDL